MQDHMKERFGNIQELSIHPSLPECLNIELNNTCNQKCIFCTYHSKYAKNKQKPVYMPISFAKKILDKAEEQGIGKKEVGFYATGEPLLYPELAECISYAKSKGFIYTFITTNGALATPLKMESLLEAGLDSIRFSINALSESVYNEIHGTNDFDAVFENLKWLINYRKEKKIKISISISSVVTKKTVLQVETIKNKFEDLVDEIVFLPVMDLDTLSLDLESELSLNKGKEVFNTRIVCPTIFNSMYINSSGKVRICCDARAANIFAADLNEEMDLDKAWNNDVMVDFRKMHMENRVKGSICEYCQSANRPIKDFFIDL